MKEHVKGSERVEKSLKKVRSNCGGISRDTRDT
jgi:hypothetical protein